MVMSEFILFAIIYTKYCILKPTFSPASGGTINVRHNNTDVMIHGITDQWIDYYGLTQQQDYDEIF